MYLYRQNCRTVNFNRTTKYILSQELEDREINHHLQMQKKLFTQLKKDYSKFNTMYQTTMYKAQYQGN